MPKVTVHNNKDIDLSERSQPYKQDAGKVWTQILAIFAVTLGPFTNGILYSWSSPFSLVISKDKENYNITEEEASYFMTFRPVGMIFASLFFFKVTELLGRKKSLLLLAVPHLIYWTIIIFAKTKWDFYIARFIGGIGDAILFSTAPPYIGEITTPTIRGYFGNMPTFFHYGGSTFITVIGSFCGVRTSSYICIGFPVLFFLLVSLLPESPYQLIKDGKYNQARKSIRWLIRKHDVEEEFEQMKADVERQMSEGGKWKDLIKIGSNRKALRAGVFLRFSQLFCGVAVFDSYTQTIFEKSGTSLGPQYSSIIFVSINWTLTLLSGIAVEKFGRKRSYFYSLLSCGTILVIISVYFILEQYNIADMSHLNWFPLLGMVIFAMTYASGLGVIPTLMLGELFSASIKSKGLSVLVGVYGVGIFLTTIIFQGLISSFGLFSPFLLYGVCCLTSTILTLRWVPETKGKTLEEIQQGLKKV